MFFRSQIVRADSRPGWQIEGTYRIALDEMLYWFGHHIVGLGAQMLFELHIARQASLPAGPKIIAPNHPSTTDPFLLTMLIAEPTNILIDDRLFQVPLFGRYLHGVGHIPVVPGNGRAAYETALQLLHAGRNVAIFPEGAVSPLEGGFHPPRTGTARLALGSGAPVIPVGIHLDRKRIRLVETPIEGKIAVGTWYVEGPYSITVGQPMRFEGDVQDRERVHAVSHEIMGRIITLTQESARRVQPSQANILRRSRQPLLVLS